MNDVEQTEQEPSAPAAREGTWASPVKKLDASKIKADINLNVDGRQLTGVVRGFGQMWQKTYRIRLTDSSATPEEIIRTWKENFGSFWPKINRFYAANSEIAAGEVAVLNLAGPYGLLAPGGRGLISTGVLVIYADDVSFSFMTPDGHIFAGMITFSAIMDGGTPCAEVQALIRASDPLFEIGARMGVVHQTEDQHWHAVLTNLGHHFGVKVQVEQTNLLVDPGVQWSEARNIVHNAAIRTGFYLAMTPVRWVAGLFRGKPAS